MQTPFQPIAAYRGAPLLSLITLMLMLQPLSTDLYLASLPGLARVFDATPAAVQLTLSLFVIGFGGAQLVVGPLSDRYGRKPVLLGGLALYVAASLLCAVALTLPMLVAARFLQALGCCSAIVVARAIVRDAYEADDSVRVMVKAGTFLSLAPIFGPVLGSYLQVTFGWRAAFVALTALSLCITAAVVLRLPETNRHKNPRATEWAGLRKNYRIVLGSRAFWAYALPGALSYGSIFAFISGSSLVLIRVLGVPTAYFGYCFAFAVSGYMLGTLVARRLLPNLGVDGALRLGTSVALAAGALFLTSVLAGVVHWTFVVAVMFLTMVAHGIDSPVTQGAAVSPFPQQAGTAAGLMGALTMGVAFAVGTIVGATFDGTVLPLASISCAIGLALVLSLRIGARRVPVQAQ